MAVSLMEVLVILLLSNVKAVKEFKNCLLAGIVWSFQIPQPNGDWANVIWPPTLGKTIIKVEIEGLIR